MKRNEYRHMRKRSGKGLEFTGEKASAKGIRASAFEDQACIGNSSLRPSYCFLARSIEKLVRGKDRRVEDLICEHFDRHGKDVDQLRSEMEALKRAHASEIDALQKKYADQVTELNTERVLLSSRVDDLERNSSMNIKSAQHQPPSEAIHMHAIIQQLHIKVQNKEVSQTTPTTKNDMPD